MAISVFLYSSLVVYAFPKRLLDGTWIDVPLSEYGEEISYFIQYAVNQIGAIYNKDFETWLKNNETYQDLYDDNGRLAKNISIDTETGEVTYTKEIMIVLKTAIDEYAREEEPYYVARIPGYQEVNASQFATKGEYLTICNLAKKYGLIGVNGLYMSDMSELLNGNYSYVSTNYLSVIPPPNDYIVELYDDSWGQFKGTQRYKFDFPAGTSSGYESVEDGEKVSISESANYHSDFYLEYLQRHNGSVLDFGTPLYLYEHTRACLVARNSFRVRVYRSLDDFKKYSVGQRKVYYTENYYNYVPEDLSVSIDDLQKSVDDLKDVIDQLLGQIGDNTSEKEIEELLKKILEAIQNQPGGSDGPGGGDVNVDIDLSGTNTLLSKILAKITQISDQISASAGQTMTDVVESISNLGEMLKKYLIAITGDLDDIKGKLEQMTEEEFSEKTDSFLNETTDSFSEIAEVAKGKFPFSIPNDMRTLLEKLSLPPPSPETAALYSADTAGAVPYSGDHGGGGASRPPGGISSIEQGNGGGSFGISESGAPVIRCPIVLERLGIDYAIKIDLSEFDKVAALSRALLTFMFIYGLYNLTFKVIGLWGDLTE